jgi:hypothetical protein
MSGAEAGRCTVLPDTPTAAAAWSRAFPVCCGKFAIVDFSPCGLPSACTILSLACSANIGLSVRATSARWKHHAHHHAQAGIAADVANMKREDTLMQGSRSADLPNGKVSQSEAAKMVGVSERLVRAYKQVRLTGAPHAPPRARRHPGRLSAWAKIPSPWRGDCALCALCCALCAFYPLGRLCPFCALSKPEKGGAQQKTASDGKRR